MKVLTFENIISLFLEEFPEFQGRAEAGRDIWGENEENDELVYVFFGWMDGMVHDLIEQNKNKTLLSRLFRFYERMAESEDERIPNLLGVEIIESLIGYPEILKTAKEYMGKNTFKMSYEMENWKPSEASLKKFNAYLKKHKKPLI